MKLTPKTLKRIINEEVGKALHKQAFPNTENWAFRPERDGTVWAEYFEFECDEFDMGECPGYSLEISEDGGLVLDGVIFEPGSAPLEIALTAKLSEPEPRKGPPAGSMPMSQSPAYSDKEKERIKRRRIKKGYGDEYKE